MKASTLMALSLVVLLGTGGVNLVQGGSEFPDDNRIDDIYWPDEGWKAKKETSEVSKSTQTQDQAESQTQSRARAQIDQSSRQVSGEIIQMKEVEVRGTDTKNTVVMLKTDSNDRRLIVDLGPTERLKSLNLKMGNDISVQGRPVEVRDSRFLVAQMIKSGDQTVMIQRQEQAMQHQGERETSEAGVAGSESYDYDY